MISNIFKQPIIILSAPRSGSTFLFETLSKGNELWTIGGESHAVIEGMPQLCPGYKDSISNELTEHDADPKTIEQLKFRFQSLLKNNEGKTYSEEINGPIRFLEKTPKNALRIRFLSKVFPDAKFIYLVRDPKENISSMIDAWNSKHFITYPYLPNFKNRWSLVLLPNWPSLVNKTNHEIATQQWKVCNSTILEELKKLPEDKWEITNYSDLIDNPDQEISKLCRFIGINKNENFPELGKNELPLSEFTLTEPKKNKWHKNAHLLASQMNQLETLIDDINLELSRSNATKINNVIALDNVKNN
ncbi:sulfotransferase family protein [Pseudoalteromonas denitrificans]|uniref:Sulfotransferase domain-containing protein n=1 Tax=Pseudoalteromonas denitrificans DSM 6059 TaxID=1123010 RepID=A0A1I1SHU5_9GAMM|nr:sulfotransferase [Pseudoalteromonas denitrificans]SFD43423.1 Sulfotransferase domain-containing protein [Pseudoalteromonas denitrificans DSM 6059]